MLLESALAGCRAYQARATGLRLAAYLRIGGCESAASSQFSDFMKRQLANGAKFRL
jgi:hypothetical protein